jgi:hypothetical protein
MGIMNKSPELKAQRGYTEAGSFVRPDGSEVLKGKDWQRRKVQLRHRSGGQCEYELRPGIRCQDDAADPCHVIPRHPTRDDRLTNLKHGCRACHERHDLAVAKRQLKWRSNEQSQPGPSVSL